MIDVTVDSETAAAVVPPSSLSVGIVTFRPDLDLLKQTVDSLAEAITEAERSLLLKGVDVTVIDNTDSREMIGAITHRIARAMGAAAAQIQFRHGHGNIGYGAAHNLALRESTSDYHLVLNPDVLVDHSALVHALRFMQANPDVGLLSPAVAAPGGAPQYLPKRFPTLFDLFLRGFAPEVVRALFRPRLDRYVMRERATQTCDDLEVASGCFMFLRRPVALQVDGFDRRFFLYFEDFDLALRMRERAKIAYVPAVKIVHFGGGASRKGPRHVQMFVASARRFYGRWGGRLA